MQKKSLKDKNLILENDHISLSFLCLTKVKDGPKIVIRGTSLKHQTNSFYINIYYKSILLV